MNQRLILLLGASLFGAFSLAAQQQSEQDTSAQAAPPTMRSTAQEVVLDMVFRDKKGRTIHDIRPEEIHVLEDGVEQKVTSFRLVEGKTAELSIAPKSSESGSLALDPMREVRLVTLVFENMDQEGKRFFRQSLKDILDMSPEQNLYFSILTVDHGLHAIQPFTADHAALLRTGDRTMMWSFVQYMNQSAEVEQELQEILSGTEPQLHSRPTGGTGQAQ